MTSEEIEKGSAETWHERWLQEIAYQLAVGNERLLAVPIQEVADMLAGPVRADSRSEVRGDTTMAGAYEKLARELQVELNRVRKEFDSLRLDRDSTIRKLESRLAESEIKEFNNRQRTAVPDDSSEI
jgi:hypothetical protein